MIAPVKCVGKEFVSYKRTIAIYIITLSVIERVLGRLRNACLHKHQAPFFCDNYFIVFIFLKYPSRPGPLPVQLLTIQTSVWSFFLCHSSQEEKSKPAEKIDKLLTNLVQSVCKKKKKKKTQLCLQALDCIQDISHSFFPYQLSRWCLRVMVKYLSLAKRRK